MSSYFDRADEIGRRWNVLAHPFYLRWSRGDLAPGELAYYAGQYRHAVVALADATAHAGDERHTAEERSHVALWDGFLCFVEGEVHAAPSPQTAACVEAWADEQRDRPATLAALYAIESAQPAISQTKLAGLVEHYGAASGTDATRYFEVHSVLDCAHAAHDRAELGKVLQPADEERLLAETERVLEANWRLLDGVEARASGLA